MDIEDIVLNKMDQTRSDGLHQSDKYVQCACVCVYVLECLLVCTYKGGLFDSDRRVECVLC